MEICNIVDCPSFSENGCPNFESCDARRLLSKDNEFKKCDNELCDSIILNGTGKKFNSMTPNSHDVKVIELCEKCAKEVESR